MSVQVTEKLEEGQKAVETVDSVENFVFRTSPEDWMGFSFAGS